MPALAHAAQVCEHPFSGGAPCVKVFGAVSIVYALIASSYGVGALLIGKPRLTSGAFKIGLVLVPVVSWLSAMLGFTLGGTMGWLAYPHDSSPFFFMDWSAFLVTFVLTTAVVVGVYKKGFVPAHSA